MSSSSVAIVLLLAVLALPAHAQTRMQIVAGPVKATGDTISGSFRIRESRRGGIVSIGTGGACLVAERSDHACAGDDDCGELRTQYHAQGWAYCLPAAGDNRRKTCWVRGADPDYCRKSPMVPLPLDTRIDLPDVAVDPLSAPGARGVYWRVVACLNGYDAVAKAGNRACGGAPGNATTSNGPPRRMP